MDTLSLDGEILAGRTRGEDRHGFVLRDYQICKIEGRAFISGHGRYPDHPHVDGIRLHVAWDDVQSFYEYETKESWEERKKLRPRSRRKWRLFRKTGHPLLMMFVVIVVSVIGSCLL